MEIARALLKTMRPKQWAKNGFVFAGLFFDQQLDRSDALLRVLITFLLLCLTASTVYIINDIADVENDRHDPKKKHRPIAAGTLPLSTAWAAGLIFPTIALGISLILTTKLTLVLVIYLALHIVYSYGMKNMVILDVFAIAGGFILRVLAGVVVIDVQQFSPWLYVCAGLLSLFLAIGKRRQELLSLGDTAAEARPVFQHYNLELLDDMLRLVLACTAIAYTLYAAEAETILVQKEYMLATVPFVYYGLFRYLYIIHVLKQGGDPTEVLYVDRPLQMGIAAWLGVLLALLYII